MYLKKLLLLYIGSMRKWCMVIETSVYVLLHL